MRHKCGAQFIDGAGARFINDCSIVIQIQWQSGFIVTLFLNDASLRNSAHVTTAKLLYHIQNFVTIRLIPTSILNYIG